jgi:hypothetical protein
MGGMKGDLDENISFGFGVGFKIGVGVALVLASEWASILK